MPRLALSLGLSAVRPSSPLDADVAAFFTVLDANGESYWQSEVMMVDNLVKAVKALSFTPVMLWFPLGGWGDNVFRAIYHPDGIGTLMTNSNFVSADWDRRVGLDGTTANKTIATGTEEADYVPSDDTHMMLISETDLVQGPADNRRDMGRVGSDGFQFIIKFQGTAGRTYYRSFSQHSGVENGTNPSSTEGVFIARRIGGDTKIWRNTDNFVSGSLNPTADTPSAGDISIFRASGEYARKVFSGASIGTGVSDDDQVAYEAALQSARASRATLHQYNTTSEIFTNLLTGVPVDKQTDVSAAASLAASGQVYNELFVLESVYYANIAAHLGAGWGCTFTSADSATPALSGEGVQSVYSWSGNKIAEQTTPANRPIARSNGLRYDNVPQADVTMNILGIGAYSSIEGWAVFDTDAPFDGTNGTDEQLQEGLWLIGDGGGASPRIPYGPTNAVIDNFGITGTTTSSTTVPDSGFDLSIYNPRVDGSGDYNWEYNGTEIHSGTGSFSINSSPLLGHILSTTRRFSGLIHAVGFHEDLFSAYRREAVRRFLAVLHNVPFNF